MTARLGQGDIMDDITPVTRLDGVDTAAERIARAAAAGLRAELDSRKQWGLWRRVLFAAGAVVIAVMAVSAGARADFQNGNELYADCTEEPVSFNRGHCLGYVVGIADVLQHPGSRVGDFATCLAKGVTEGQVRDVALQFLTQHPELRHYAAAYLVARALAEAFPCPK